MVIICTRSHFNGLNMDSKVLLTAFGVLLFAGAGVQVRKRTVWRCEDDCFEPGSGGVERCYSCFGTGSTNECENYTTYKDGMEGRKSGVWKNCTAPHDNVCFIERYIDRGNVVSHIRDCNDGVTFSFNSSVQNEKGAYIRLFQLANNNETSCVYDGIHMVCLSKCDTELCNGPFETEFTSGCDVTRMSFIVMVIVQLVPYLITI